jgi:hypothetical protein
MAGVPGAGVTGLLAAGWLDGTRVLPDVFWLPTGWLSGLVRPASVNSDCIPCVPADVTIGLSTRAVRTLAIRGRPPDRAGRGVIRSDGQAAVALLHAQLPVGIVGGARVAGGVQRRGLVRGEVQAGGPQVGLELAGPQPLRPRVR